MSFLSDALAAYDGRRNRIVCTCKYVRDSDVILDGLFADHQIRFSQAWALNDPVEVNPVLVLNFGDNQANYTHYIYQDLWLPSYRDQVYINLIEARYNRYGILSLSKQLFGYDMWNRYASAHKGYIIDFKQDMDEKKVFRSTGLFSGMVNYAPKHQIVISRPIGDEGYATYDYLLEELFLKKTDHWKAESEYRIVRPLSEHADYCVPKEHKSYRDERIFLFDFDPSAISCVIFGAAMSGKKKRKIVELTKELGIGYFQCLVDKSDDYALYYLPMTLWKDTEKFYSMLPQLFFTDGTEFEYRDLVKKVESLDQIPYCSDEKMKVSLAEYVQRRRRRAGV